MAKSFEPIDVHRKDIVLSGNAFDLNRVVQACTNVLKQIEFNGYDTQAKVKVYVQAPQEDES
jgi:hypothetical protein